MKWHQALSYAAKYPDSILYDKNGHPHWIEQQIGWLANSMSRPIPCSESDAPFSPSLEPYRAANRGDAHFKKVCNQ